MFRSCIRGINSYLYINPIIITKNNNFIAQHFSYHTIHSCNTSQLNNSKCYVLLNKICTKFHKEYGMSPLQSFHVSSATTNSNSHNESETKFDGSISVSEAIKICMERFKAEDIPEAELHASYIVAHIIEVNKNDLSLNESSLLSPTEMEKLNAMIECRLARMPLQYIIGNWDFHSITLKLCPPVFIPRMETEQLVELALKKIDGKSSMLNILDICCGSGAIALAILKNNFKINCFAIDKSEYAVNLAAENATDLGLSERLTLIHGQIANNDLPRELCDKKFDLIVCNPPYVPRKDTIGMQKEILLYEDMQAIDGGDEGLEIIKPILRHCQNMLTENGEIIMEIDPSQSSSISKWLSSEGIRLRQSAVHKDYNDRDRFLEFTLY